MTDIVINLAWFVFGGCMGAGTVLFVQAWRYFPDDAEPTHEDPATYRTFPGGAADISDIARPNDHFPARKER